MILGLMVPAPYRSPTHNRVTVEVKGGLGGAMEMTFKVYPSGSGADPLAVADTPPTESATVAMYAEDARVFIEAIEQQLKRMK